VKPCTVAVAPPVVTTTSTVPGEWEGAVAVMLGRLLMRMGTATTPKETVAPGAKPLPVIVTVVGALVGPPMGRGR